MTVTFDIPREIEESLARDAGDVNLAIKEAALVELYRVDRLSHRGLGEAMGLDRFETEALLKRHQVTEDYPTAEEYEAALRALGIARNG